MSHSISRANLGVFFLSHKLAVVNLSWASTYGRDSSLRGYRHCVPQNHPPRQGRRFRFISHKFTASNLRYQARRMNNRSYVTEQTTTLHLIYQKFNYLWRKHKHPLFPWQGTVGWALGRVSAHKRSVCRVSEANRTRPRTSVQQTLRQISYSFRCKQSRQLPWWNHANCRGIHCTYIVHTRMNFAVIGKISSHWITLDTQVSHG